MLRSCAAVGIAQSSVVLHGVALQQGVLNGVAWHCMLTLCAWLCSRVHCTVLMALQWHWHQQALLGVMSPWELHCVVLRALHGADGFVGCSGALQGFNVCL